MPKDTVTVRVDHALRESVDAIAAATNLDRSGVINQALIAYVETHQWQVDHIREGLRQADAGEFLSERKVKKVLSRLTAKR
jgi:predicted transcriptional regulator